jgi:hypothetical protein
MARTEITKTVLPGKYADDAVDLGLQAMDTANGNQVSASGKDIIILHNTNVGAQTVTVVSTEDEYGREEDQAIALDPDEMKLAGPYPVEGWRQTDKKLYLDTTSDDVKVAVIKQEL